MIYEWTAIKLRCVNTTNVVLEKDGEDQSDRLEKNEVLHRVKGKINALIT